MILERWALPLSEAVGLVPKTIQAPARTDIACACASCEMCSYHLGLDSLDMLPPLKGMYICSVCNWQCLLETNCYNTIEREAIDTNTHGPAQPVFT